MTGLYVHIPFCRKKCFYCDFFSVEYENILSESYINAVTLQAKTYKGSQIGTVYIGGGTPSVLSEKQILKLLEAVNLNFDLSEVREFTFELNPESASREKLKILKECGVNRLSMGLQSVDDETLKKLGRVHDFNTFEKSLEAARKEKFENISFDLIYGLPWQDMKNCKKNLEAAADFECNHISLYPLSIEEGTEFHRIPLSADGDLQREMYEMSVEFLSKKGFVHYEISNWAKPGKESIHNSNYWRNREYIALGAGASGYLHRFRYTNCRDIVKYTGNIQKGLPVKEENEFINDELF